MEHVTGTISLRVFGEYVLRSFNEATRTNLATKTNSVTKTKVSSLAPNVKSERNSFLVTISRLC